MNPEKEKYVRICPKCKSTNISLNMSNPAIKYIGQIEDMKCNDCGFTGTIFPEIPESEVSDNKNTQKQK